ncbi:GPI transamidase component PIG-S isoform X2 [Cimex lectularius]|uniref:GPI transamidase component PIG-S n=1 Tax=Cimex lectularius TaxID=79782 RepID=A0A8I6RGA4_CIMLE|nr:GPI transamidase component PIG-S isoform X2 [Cimex lectularius]
MQKMDCESDSEKLKMWAAISFAVMLIVIGIPLWWKTTEVERAFLPYDEIYKLKPSVVNIQMKVFIHCQYPSRTNALIGDLKNMLMTDIYDLVYTPFKINNEIETYLDIENDERLNNVTYGNILLVEVHHLPQRYKVLVSNKRIIYFTPETSNHLIVEVMRDWHLRESDLKTKIKSIIVPQSVQESENLDSLRAALNYDMVFTIINSNPENVKLVWDISTDIKRYIKPLLDQISAVSLHSLKSQWLYFIDFGVLPEKNSNGYTLPLSQLPHIITPLEKKLGSGISKNPCVHLILYTSSCDQSPLSFVSPTGRLVNSMISPQWGGVQIINPSQRNCKEGEELKVDSKKIMAVFVSQIHTLLGIQDNNKRNPLVGLFNSTGGTLRDWELDKLYRIRTVEQITSASLTLQSLSKLLGEISNIVINEDVASSINDAIKYVKLASNSLGNSKLDEALNYSRVAYQAAETAFSDPSLLALLYFPDDQKYAVYIPLFLPIMIPVLMSLKKIQMWVFYGTTKVNVIS